MLKIIAVLLLFTINSYAQDSLCFGNTSRGYIENAVQLPIRGDNFVVYNKLGYLLGRNYVHSKVLDVVIGTYSELAHKYPEIKYKYGETGWENGGNFEPHKTHQNGLSVDFMVPVVDKQGKSTYFSSDLSNKFGYGVEFNKKGKFENISIDFEAIALHLAHLHKVSLQQDIEIWRVIFAPEFRVKLLQTSQADYLRNNIKFMGNKAWIRHDEHYHVDFELKCRN